MKTPRVGGISSHLASQRFLSNSQASQSSFRELVAAQLGALQELLIQQHEQELEDAYAKSQELPQMLETEEEAPPCERSNLLTDCETGSYDNDVIPDELTEIVAVDDDQTTKAVDDDPLLNAIELVLPPSPSSARMKPMRSVQPYRVCSVRSGSHRPSDRMVSKSVSQSQRLLDAVARGEASQHVEGLDVRAAWCRAPSWVFAGDAGMMSQGLTTLAKRPLKRSSSVYTYANSKGFSIEAYMLDPSSWRRFFWDTLAAVMILYDTATLPLGWGFGWDLPTPADSIVMWLIVLFFTADIPLTCFTGYYNEGNLVKNPRLVFYYYAKSYMILDLMAVVPDWISIIINTAWSGTEEGYFRISKSIRMLRILRTFKLIRLARLNRFAHDFIASISSEYWVNFLRIARLSAVLLLVSHYVACGWYAVGTQNADGWVEDSGVQDSGFQLRYLTCLAWALSHYTGLESEAVARTTLELTYSCVIAWMSMLSQSYLVSSLTNAMSHVARFHGRSTQRRWLIHQYLQDQRISKPLQTRVRKFLAEASHTMIDHNVDISSVFADMPPYLLMEINTEVVTPLLNHNFFLRACSIKWRHMVPKLCQECFKQTQLIEDEALFSLHEKCRRLPFLLEGVLRYEARNQTFEAVEQQRWYCEAGMFLSFLHRGSMLCTEAADFVCLELAAFERIVTQHPVLHREMAEVAFDFRQWVLSDSSVGVKLNDLTRAGARDFTGSETQNTLVLQDDLTEPINPSLKLLKTARAHRHTAMDAAPTDQDGDYTQSASLSLR